MILGENINLCLFYFQKYSDKLKTNVISFSTTAMYCFWLVQLECTWCFWCQIPCQIHDKTRS